MAAARTAGTGKGAFAIRPMSQPATGIRIMGAAVPSLKATLYGTTWARATMLYTGSGK